jgi:hypothetical protein
LGITIRKYFKKMLQVKKSNIPNSGLGVFALKDFREGEIIGYYDGKVLTDISEKKNNGDYVIKFSKEIFNEKDDEDAKPNKTEHVTIDGYKNPINPNGVIQLCNDNIYVQKIMELIVDMTRVENDVLIVQRIVLKVLDEMCSQHNVYFSHFEDDKAYYRAIKDINKGDELYNSYGLPYWFSRLNCDVIKDVDDYKKGKLTDDDYKRLYAMLQFQKILYFLNLYYNLASQKLTIDEFKELMKKLSIKFSFI